MYPHSNSNILYKFVTDFIRVIWHTKHDATTDDDELLDELENNFFAELEGEVKIKGGNVHEYLGMEIDFTIENSVYVAQIRYTLFSPNGFFDNKSTSTRRRWFSRRLRRRRYLCYLQTWF